MRVAAVNIRLDVHASERTSEAYMGEPAKGHHRSTNVWRSEMPLHLQTRGSYLFIFTSQIFPINVISITSRAQTWTPASLQPNANLDSPSPPSPSPPQLPPPHSLSHLKSYPPTPINVATTPTNSSQLDLPIPNPNPTHTPRNNRPFPFQQPLPSHSPTNSSCVRVRKYDPSIPNPRVRERGLREWGFSGSAWTRGNFFLVSIAIQGGICKLNKHKWWLKKFRLRILHSHPTPFPPTPLLATTPAREGFLGEKMS